MFNKIVTIEDAFNKEQCESLKVSEDWRHGTVGDGEFKKSIRRSKVIFGNMFKNPEVYSEIIALFSEVNNEVYKFEMDYIDAIQLTLYNQDDEGFYRRHVDTFPMKEIGNQRKLSVSILLSDPNEFSGGDLNIYPEGQWGDAVTAPRKMGCAVFFPSYLEHEVTPIKSGKRYSLVSWAGGPSFR